MKIENILLSLLFPLGIAISVLFFSVETKNEEEGILVDKLESSKKKTRIKEIIDWLYWILPIIFFLGLFILEKVK